MTLGPVKPILERAMLVAELHLDIQQFGQANDNDAWDGTTACTHADCQYLTLLWTGEILSINDVNRLSGMPKRATKRLPNGRLIPRGMNSNELQAFFERMHLPYVVRFGLTFETVLTLSNRAPCFYGNRYGTEPRQKGAVYHGVKAKAPFAIKGGATQLTGSLLDGRHGVVLLGYRSVVDAKGKPTSYQAWRKDPNHGSTARRERPPYDVIKTTEALKEYEAYATLAPRTYSAIPTRTLPL